MRSRYNNICQIHCIWAFFLLLLLLPSSYFKTLLLAPLYLFYIAGQGRLVCACHSSTERENFETLKVVGEVCLTTFPFRHANITNIKTRTKNRFLIRFLLSQKVFINVTSGLTLFIYTYILHLFILLFNFLFSFILLNILIFQWIKLN